VSNYNAVDCERSWKKRVCWVEENDWERSESGGGSTSLGNALFLE